MRRMILYILPLLLLVVLLHKIFSQPPIWPTGNIGSINISLYATQLVYSFNITSNFTSANVQFITFTVPEQVLQQQLQYCKTYDPFVTNNVSPSQCEFGFPVMAVLYNSQSINNPTGYITFYIMDRIINVSYDNVTGLPQTFVINLGSLSPGTYYLYVYYLAPYFYSFSTIHAQYYYIDLPSFDINVPSCPSNFTNITPSDFNNGWCGAATAWYFINQYPWAKLLQSKYFGILTLTRYLYVKFNPLYPVLIVYPISYTNVYLYSYESDQGSITVMNPSTGQTKTITFSGGTLYDLRLLELQNGLDPNQWNEIVNVSISSSMYGSIVNIPGFFLIYVPQT